MAASSSSSPLFFLTQISPILFSSNLLLRITFFENSNSSHIFAANVCINLSMVPIPHLNLLSLILSQISTILSSLSMIKWSCLLSSLLFPNHLLLKSSGVKLLTRFGSLLNLHLPLFYKLVLFKLSFNLLHSRNDWI